MGEIYSTPPPSLRLIGCEDCPWLQCRICCAEANLMKQDGLQWGFGYRRQSINVSPSSLFLSLFLSLKSIEIYLKIIKNIKRFHELLESKKNIRNKMGHKNDTLQSHHSPLLVNLTSTHISLNFIYFSDISYFCLTLYNYVINYENLC